MAASDDARPGGGGGVAKSYFVCASQKILYKKKPGRAPWRATRKQVLEVIVVRHGLLVVPHTEKNRFGGACPDIL